jgi:outer membrane protein assembly factor BamB
MYGYDLSRTNYNPAETAISAANVTQLVPRWQAPLGYGAIPDLSAFPSSSAPVVADGRVFVGSSVDSGPNYFAFDARTGAPLWSKDLGHISAPECPPNVGIGSTAAISGTVLVGGGGDAAYYGLDTATGAQLWRQPLDAGASGFAWASPLLAHGRAYLGAVSYCDNPSVRGEVRTVDLLTGVPLARQYFVPETERGAGVWNSPALGPDGQTLVVATGEDYFYDGLYNRALVTLNSTSLAILGANKQGLTFHDHDWGTTPIIFHDSQGRTLVGAANKNGTFYAYLLNNIHAGPVWQRYTDVSVGAMPAYDPTFGAGGTLFIVGNRTIYAVDPATGADRYPPFGTYELFGNVALANGLLFVNLGGGGVQIFNERTGAELTHLIPANSGDTFSGVTVAQGTVYWTAGGYLNAWSLPDFNTGTATPSQTAPPAPGTPTRTVTPESATATAGAPTATATQAPAASPTSTVGAPTRTPTGTRTPGGPTVTATATPGCAPGFGVQPGPSISGGDSGLHAVIAAGPGDLWAVGSYHPVDAAQTRIAHWTGSAWSVVPSPNVGSGDNSLQAIGANTADDIWAVGAWYTAAGIAQTLIEHWDGNAWQVVPSPNVGSGDNTLLGVATFATGDVWAVGAFRNAGVSQTLIEHWDGSAWRVVPSPNGAGGTGVLQAVNVYAGHDVWAVGYSDKTLIEHWDGSAWSVVPSPNPGAGINVLRAVAAFAPDDVWAVGYYRNGFGSLPLTEHWDGSAWRVVPSPNPGSVAWFNELNAVTALANTDVWAVGFYSTGGANGGVMQPLAEHWTGSAWVVVPTTPGGSGNSQFYGVAGGSTPEVWAVGAGADGAATQPLVEHYPAACVPVTATPTRTATPTATGTATSTVPPTLTATGTATSTVPPTLTASATPTTTATVSATGTATAAPSPPLTATGTTTAPPTGTPSPPSAPTGTATPSATATVTATPTSSVPPTGTGLPSPSPTGTAVAVPTSSPTTTVGVVPATPTTTATGTARPTSTLTPGAIPTGAATATRTAVGTATPPAPRTPIPPPCLVTFGDVPPGSPFYRFVRCLACQGIVAGYSDGTFHPASAVTRGQVAKFVANAAGYTDAIPANRQSFADVPASDPFWLFIERVTAHGVVSGYSDGTFHPAAAVTRGQMSKFVANAAGYNDAIPADRQTFQDVPASDPFWVFIERVVGQGIVSGYSDGTFHPGAGVTRGQTAKFIANAFFPNCAVP